MTARPMTDDLLEGLLNRLGWAYIEVGTGAGTLETADEVDRVTKEITDLFLSTSAAVRGMREALERLANHNGGITYRGQVDLMKEIARAALSGIEPGEDEQARGQGPTAPTDRLQSKESSS